MRGVTIVVVPVAPPMSSLTNASADGVVTVASADHGLCANAFFAATR